MINLTENILVAFNLYDHPKTDENNKPIPFTRDLKINFQELENVVLGMADLFGDNLPQLHEFWEEGDPNDQDETVTELTRQYKRKYRQRCIDPATGGPKAGN